MTTEFLQGASHGGHMHEDYSAAIYVKTAMLIRASIDGPLFYEFIFNLSFVPRLVCPRDSCCLLWAVRLWFLFML